ncbi:MAG: phage portal protein [Paraclostridium sp.]
MLTIKQILLGLNTKEMVELEKIKTDYFFYRGATVDEDLAALDIALRGQSWINADDVDFIPTQIIDNKIKPLIHKQARFFLGKEPILLLKSRQKEDKEKCEELRVFVDDILTDNGFWSDTMKAFRIATVTKRVLLRMEVNEGCDIKLCYHDVNDFNYEFDKKDKNKLKSVKFVRYLSRDGDNELWGRYIYEMSRNEDASETCKLKTEIFSSLDLDTPVKKDIFDTKLSIIPCWIFINEHDLINRKGESDITDLKPLQNQYNRRLSDFSDALRFQMFGQTVIVDATEETVNEAKIAPNSLLPLVSKDDGKQAQAYRVESSFSNAEPAKMFLNILEDSMYEKLSIPRPEQLNNIPSAKAIKYIYNDLIARCHEKWNDWEPNIISMINLIIEVCSKLNHYEGYSSTWNNLDYYIVLKKNFPIPEDEEDSKRLAMEEVKVNVRSNRSYIKDFGDDDDYEEAFNEVIEDNKSILAAEQDQFQIAVQNELGSIDDGLDDNE